MSPLLYSSRRAMEYAALPAPGKHRLGDSMKSFSEEIMSRPVQPGLNWLIADVSESKGKQELFTRQRPEVLETLRQAAIIQSTESSNRIEGVTVDRKRLAPLVLGKVKPKDRSEEEIVGYREALALIHKNHSQIMITPETLMRLHEICQGEVSGDAGQWKKVDNDIIEIFPDGSKRLRFKTMPWKEVPGAVEQLCLSYHHAYVQGLLHPLLAASSFVLDFLCIHPFRDGNGRTSRLLTLLLLYHQGLEVGRYISLERLVEDTKESYYDALNRSSSGWHDGEHDLVPWQSYFLSTIRSAYKEFEERVDRLGQSTSGNKTEDVKRAVQDFFGEFTISDVENRCPHVSRVHIRRILRGMREAGDLELKGSGRSAAWRKTK